MLNVHKAAAIQVMSEMMMVLDQIGSTDVEMLLICRMVQITFEYGLAPYSALAFAMTSQLYVASRDDVDAGFRFARLSVALLEKLDARQTSAKVLLYSQFAMHWREPLSITVDQWIDGYHRGMRNGDLNSAAQVSVDILQQRVDPLNRVDTDHLFAPRLHRIQLAMVKRTTTQDFRLIPSFVI
jgi:predicted ATPase